jgi:hypothetical protein
VNSLEKKIFSYIEILAVAVNSATESSDLSDRLTLKGKTFEGFIHWATNSLNGLPEGNYISLTIDGEKYSKRHELNILEKYKDDKIDSWEFTLNKKSLFESVGSSKGFYFFFSYTSLKSWLERLDVLQMDSFPEAIDGVKIFLWEAESSFGGPNFQILSPKDYLEAPKMWPEVRLPVQEAIRSEVHIIANKVLIQPNLFLITKCSGNIGIDEILIRNSFVHLAPTIVNFFYSLDRISLNGIRSIELPLIRSGEHPSLDDIEQLKVVVEWVYEERVDTRNKLLSDRLSLEIDPHSSLFIGLAKHLKPAFQQAKDQYKFVILDRKDKYYQELRGLLVGLQGQSKEYSEKIRSMTDGLFRDVLASLFLVAFSLFSKTDVDEIAKLLKNPNFQWLLKGLGIYFFISYFFQLINNWNDLRISKNELKYWIKTTHNYLGEKEIEEKLKEAGKARERNYFWTVIALGVVYLFIGLFCWFMNNIFGA